MNIQSSAARNLYAELAETATLFDVLIVAGPGKGSLKERTLSGKQYLYWQFRDVAGRVREQYLGADRAEVRQLADSLVANRRAIDELKQSVQLLAGAFLAAGGMRNQIDHFKVLEALALSGLFQKGAVLVGSHAFVALGNLLGYSWSSSAMATQDIDFARARSVEVAVAADPALRIDVPGALAALDMGFFLVPELDHRLPSSSLQTNKGRVKVDFLTVLRGRDDHTPVYLDDLKIAAQPLRFMDYLLGGEVAKGHVIGPYALPVLLPSPGRFVLHKLVVSELRPLSARAKAHKELLQAAWLTRALDASVPSELMLAAQALPEYPGMLTRPGCARRWWRWASSTPTLRARCGRWWGSQVGCGYPTDQEL